MAYIQLQLRRGTRLEWFNTNPVLAVAEMAIETDTMKFKIGDGTTSWNSLPYGGITGGLGYTGSSGAGTGGSGNGYTGSRGFLGYTGSLGIGYSGSRGGGYSGSRGFDGSQGPQGDQGDPGGQGDPGDRGDKGYTGSLGYFGSKGAVGYAGSKGDTGVGYAGSAGATGSGTGYAGSAGVGYTGSSGGGGTGNGYAGSVGYTGSSGGGTGNGYAGSVGYAGSAGTGYSGSKGYAGSLGYTGSAGTGGGSSVRVTITGTVTGNANIALKKAYALLQISVSSAVWLRLYPANYFRTVDASRGPAAEPNYNTGVILEIISTGATTYTLTPAVVGYNLNSPPDEMAYLSVLDPTGSSPATTTVTFIYLPLEI